MWLNWVSVVVGGNWRGIQLVVGSLVGPVAVVVLELALEEDAGVGAVYRLRASIEQRMA